MRARPLDPGELAAEVVRLVLTRPAAERPRVALDGAPATEPVALADQVVQQLRATGRPAVVVPAEGFLRPASLRFERGRDDPDAFFEDRLDEAALAREVLDPLGTGGDARFLPSLWDPVRDRATRADYLTAAPGTVVLVPGSLLLGRWLAFDLTVHLSLRAGALRRRTPPDLQWTLPAYARYEREVAPVSSADLAILVDDPRHPALVLGD